MRTARMPTISTLGQEFCIWVDLYIDNKDISAAQEINEDISVAEEYEVLRVPHINLKMDIVK